MINVNLLPKHLRRVQEPGYWRVVAVLFPLVVLGTLAFVQFTVSQTVNNLADEVSVLEERKRALQPFIAQQRDLQTQLQQVNELLGIRDQVRENRVVWTQEIAAVLETLPAQGDAARPRIDFQNLSMQAVSPPRADENRFEGQPILAEMNVSGNAVNASVLSDFISNLETSDAFGVSFQNAARDDETGLFSYSLTIGALTGGEQ